MNKDISNSTSKGYLFPVPKSFKYGLFGPAIILLAFGQATGELIHWPYLIMSYGLFFLFLLLPACLIQYPTFVFLARHTLLSGESHLLILSKINKFYAVFAWVIFILTSIWIASYTASGGIALAKLYSTISNTPVDLASVGKYSALLINTIFFIILISLPKTYRFIKGLMSTIAILSLFVVIILFVVTVYKKGLDTQFIYSIFDIKTSFPDDWVRTDAKLLLTAIVFSGLGGLWNILYSVWLSQEEMGMSNQNSKDYLKYRKNIIKVSQCRESIFNYTKAMSLIKRDLWIGIGGNTSMILMIAYIVYVSFPSGMAAPAGLGIITSLGDAVSYDSLVMASIFYVFIGLFLIDTWVTAADSLSKLHANMTISFLKTIDKEEHRAKVLYLVFLFGMLIMTFISSFIARPEQLNYLNGVLSMFGASILIIGLFLVERYYVINLPSFPKHTTIKFFLILTFIIYSSIGVAFCLL